MKEVDYKQLKRYDIGKMPTDTGYQVGQQANLTGISSTPGQDISNQIKQTNTSTIHSGISQLGTLGYNAYNLANSFTTASSAAAQNLAKAVSNGWIAGGKFTEAGVKAATDAGLTGAKVGGIAGEKTATAMLGDSAVSSGMSAAGYVTGGIGAALSAYGLANDIAGFSDKLSGNDMMNMSGRQTQSKYGVQYNTYGGLNSGQIRDYTKAQNRASTTSMAMNGAGLGMSVGGMIGGPLGMGIGAVLGGLGGFIGGTIGGNSRSNAVEEEMQRALEAQRGYNLQEESKAGSKGLRNQFRAGLADKGKNVYDAGKPMKSSLIHTERGVEKGVMQGLAEPREGIVDMTRPYTHYLGSIDPNVVEERKDKIPVGSNFDWGKDVILGNKYMWGKNTNPRYADIARIPLKQNEEINLKREAGLSTPEDEQKYMKNWNFLRKLGAMQSAESNPHSLRADKGKNIRRFDKGWESYAPVANFLTNVPLFMNHRNIIGNEANVDVPVVENPNTRQSLNTLYGLRVDPTQQLNDIHSTQRQARYNILNSPLSAGMQNAMNLANMYNARNMSNQVISEANKTNNAYLSDAAKANMAAGDAYAKSANQINEFNKQNQIKQNSDQRTMRLQLNADTLKAKGQLFQDWDTARRYNQMMDLYNRSVTNDEIRTMNEIEQSRRNRLKRFVSDVREMKPVSVMPSIASILPRQISLR